MFIAGEYSIDIYKDKEFRKGSADNLYNYDVVYLFDEENVLSTMIGIKVGKGGQLLKSAIIGADGGATAIHDNAIIAETKRVIVCCGNSVFCLSIPDLSVLWHTQADEMTCFGIFKYKDSYIVHGEMNISRIDGNGNIVWQQTGADIFTTINGEDSFILTEDFIIVKDFKNRIYKFNYDGKDSTDMSQFA